MTHIEALVEFLETATVVLLCLANVALEKIRRALNILSDLEKAIDRMRERLEEGKRVEG